MTDFALAPATATTELREDVAAMLAAGELHAYRVRGNGSMRRIQLCPVGSTARETAEWVSDRVDYDGATVNAVARELHVSTASVRRIMLALELTEEIEAGEWDGIWGAYGETTQVAADDTDEPQPSTEAADVAKDAALLARNQARFTPVAQDPTPTAPAPQQADQAPPVGGVATATGTALAVCFCGDQGAHGLGTSGCKHTAPAARYARSHG